MGRLETEILTARRNLKELMNLPGTWIDRVRQRGALDKLIQNLDSSASETHGRPEASAQRRAESTLAKHDHAVPRVRCSRRLAGMLPILAVARLP